MSSTLLNPPFSAERQDASRVGSESKQRLTKLSLKATTVDLLIFGTAEPATAIMAASIPMLRVLIRPNSSSKPPTEFVELVSRRKSGSSLPRTDTKRNWTGEDSWSEEPALEQARVRGHNDRGKEGYEWAT